MDYESAYKQALERAKSMMALPDDKAMIEEIFPELAEPDDEKIRKELIDYFSAYHATDTFRGISWDRVVSWLEKQCEQKPVEWDESIIDETISLINNLASGYGEKVDEPITFNGVKMINNIMERLRAIKPQPKQEWSEEDQKIASRIAYVLEEAASEHAFMSTKRLIGDKEVIEIEGWLKSLEDRYTWKPSDEQMASITCAVRKMKESACYDSELVSLFNDLKKLRDK